MADNQRLEARLNVTYNGQNGDLQDPIRVDMTDGDIKAIAAEAIRSGAVAGVAPHRFVDLHDFVIDRFPADAQHPYQRVFVRPKTPFG